MSVGIIVGRFQVPVLHDGHRQLLEYVHQKSDEMLVVVGTIDGPPNDRYPLPFKAIKDVLTGGQGFSFSEKLEVIPLVDSRCHQLWSERLDAMITSYFPMKKVTLYGGRDSFIQYYSGKYPTEEVNLAIQDSGSVLRRDAASRIRDNASFRQGLVYSQLNRLPVIYPTVDIAMLKRTKKGKDVMVLLARKLGEKSWRFPGGFVDFTDPDFETAAKREFLEETGMICEHGVEPVGSFTVGDWRSTGRTKIMTTLFMAWYFAGSPEPQPRDDIEEVMWVPIQLAPELMVEHIPLWEGLQKWWLKR